MPTLSFSPSTQGWPSRYSYQPDFMVGMNNAFYSFNRGRLWLHNDTLTPNEYYGNRYQSYMKTVFNQNPLENKLFKTINIEGTDNWNVDVTTDLQVGEINDNWFERKEAAFFGYIRNNDNDPIILDDTPQRSVNGLGTPNEVTPVGSNVVLSFVAPAQVDDMISIGDGIYEVTNVLTLVGYVIGFDRVANTITVNNIDTIGTNDPLAYVKNNVAESHGVLGHYCIVEMSNDKTFNSELFAVESEVMKSFP